MATSGSFSWTTSNQYIDAKVAWSLVSQDIAKNTSTIDVSISFTRTNTGYTTTRKWSGSIFCGANVGTNEHSTTSDTLTIVNGSYAVGQTMRVTIGHDSDGNCSFIVGSRGGTLAGGSSNYTVPAYYERFYLPQIKRATTPTLSATTTEMGKSVTINCPRASSSFTHTLTYAWGSSSGTIASGVGTSYAWTIPLSFANNIPSATKGQGTITCKTYSGSTLIGSKDITFYATVPSSVVPSISSVALSDPNGHVSKYGAYVQNKSKVKVQVSASGSYSSTISSVSITVMGITSTSNPYTSGLVNIAGGTGTVSVTVKDSRGRTASKSVTFSVLAYSNPVVSYIKARRCTSDGTIDEDNGEYVKIEYSASITSLNSKNGKSFTIQYKEASASSWTTLATYDSSYTCTGSCIAEANVDNSYDVRIVAADTFSSTTSQNVVGTTFTTFDVKANGKGFGFGKAAETDDLLDIAWNIRGRKNITSDSNIIAGGNINAGNNITANSNVTAGNKVVANSDVIAGGIVYPKYGTIVHQCSSGGGTSGWVKFAQIKVVGTWNDEPIFFEINQRGYFGILAIRFNSVDNTDPSLAYIRAVGYGLEGYIIKSATSTWDVYLKKVGSWDEPAITGLHFGAYGRYRTTITWKDEAVSSVSGGTSSNSGPFEINTKFGFRNGCLYHNGVQVLSPALLWSGTLSTDATITVTNFNRYNFFVMQLSNGVNIIGGRISNLHRLDCFGMRDWGSSTGTYTYKASFTVNSSNTNSITATGISYHKLLASGTSHEGGRMNVTHIYGVF